MQIEILTPAATYRSNINLFLTVRLTQTLRAGVTVVVEATQKEALLPPPVGMMLRVGVRSWYAGSRAAYIATGS